MHDEGSPWHCRGLCGHHSEHHGCALLLHHLPGHVQHDVSHAHSWLRALSHVQVSAHTHLLTHHDSPDTSLMTDAILILAHVLIAWLIHCQHPWCASFTCQLTSVRKQWLSGLLKCFPADWSACGYVASMGFELDDRLCPSMHILQRGPAGMCISAVVN